MKKTKPIIRWIVGNCHKLGYEVLYCSIDKLKKIYKDRFTYCICFNSKEIDENLKKSLEKANLVYDQKKIQDNNNVLDIFFKEFGPHWKLCPPRLFEDTHEIILDNDLIIYNDIDEIEKFLESDDMFVTTRALKRSYNSQYDYYIKNNFNINTGLVGLPPNFNYKTQIEKTLNLRNELRGPRLWGEYFDEQTLVAAVLQNQNTKVIPFKIISTSCSLTGLRIGEGGTHFLGTNKGFDYFWIQFKIKHL